MAIPANTDFTKFQWATLLDEIKREGRVKGTDQLDTLILNTVNDLLLQYCLSNRYLEMLLTNQPITTIIANGTYSTPTGFQLLRLLRYQRSDGFKYTLIKRPEWIENPTGKNPRYYEISSGVPTPTLNIFPTDNIPDGDTLLLDYYQYPAPIQSLTDIFPIPKLIASIKQKAIYRVHVYQNEIPAAQALKSDAGESEARSKPSGTIS